MNNRTDQNDENNRLKSLKDELQIRLRPIWQGHVESNHDLRFWRPLY